jgi:hypothetical protein
VTSPSLLRRRRRRERWTKLPFLLPISPCHLQGNFHRVNYYFSVSLTLEKLQRPDICCQRLE